MTSVVEFESLMEKKRELEEQIKNEAQEVFSASAKAIFEQYGDKVAIFGWNQYTPYFNDGDPCVFGSGETFIYTPGEVEEGDINHWESEGIYSYSGNSEDIYKNKETGELTQYPSYREMDNYEVVPNPDFDPAYDEAKKAVQDLVGLLDDDTRLALFGDHATIIVTPSGVEVETCEHE